MRPSAASSSVAIARYGSLLFLASDHISNNYFCVSERGGTPGLLFSLVTFFVHTKKVTPRAHPVSKYKSPGRKHTLPAGAKSHRGATQLQTAQNKRGSSSRYGLPFLRKPRRYPGPVTGAGRSSLLGGIPLSVDSHGTIHHTLLADPHTTAGSLCNSTAWLLFSDLRF